MTQYATVERRIGSSDYRWTGLRVIANDQIRPGEIMVINDKEVMVARFDGHGYPLLWYRPPGYSRFTEGAHEAARMVRGR